LIGLIQLNTHKALDEQIEDAGTRREKARKAAEARWNEAA